MYWPEALGHMNSKRSDFVSFFLNEAFVLSSSPAFITWGEADSFVSSQDCEASWQTFPILFGQYQTKLNPICLYMLLLLLTLVFVSQCRCGFAGETGPRFIIPSEIRKPGQQHVRRAWMLKLVMFLSFFLLDSFHVVFPYFRQPKWFSTTSTQKSSMSSSKSLSIYCTSGELPPFDLIGSCIL